MHAWLAAVHNTSVVKYASVSLSYLVTRKDQLMDFIKKFTLLIEEEIWLKAKAKESREEEEEEEEEDEEEGEVEKSSSYDCMSCLSSLVSIF